mgnify:CR=1 FL=1
MLSDALLAATRHDTVTIVGDTDVDVVITPHMHLDRIGTQGDAAIVFVTDEGVVYGVYDLTHSGLAPLGRHYTRAYPYRAPDALFFVVHNDGKGLSLQTYAFAHPDIVRIAHDIPTAREWKWPAIRVEREHGSMHTHAWMEKQPYFHGWTLELCIDRPVSDVRGVFQSRWIRNWRRTLDPAALQGVDPHEKPWLEELVTRHVVRVLLLRLD